MNFKCPECGAERLQEVSTNCTVVQEILEFGEPGCFEYGDQETFYGNGEDYYFECAECNFPLPSEITSDEKLIEFLKNEEA